MTPERLQREYLSFRRWTFRTVVPTMAILLLMLFAFGQLYDGPRERDHSATIVGFFAFYLVLVRGGHMIMIRSLHFDMLKTDGEAYRAELSTMDNFARKNIGFTLAKIKRRILDAKRAKAQHYTHKR